MPIDVALPLHDAKEVLDLARSWLDRLTEAELEDQLVSRQASIVIRIELVPGKEQPPSCPVPALMGGVSPAEAEANGNQMNHREQWLRSK